MEVEIIAATPAPEFFVIEWSVGGSKVKKERFDNRAEWVARRVAIAESAGALGLNMSCVFREYTACVVATGGSQDVNTVDVPKKTRKPRTPKVGAAA